MTGVKQLTGRHVLWILIAGFGLVFAVNGVMAWFALDTFPGLVSNDAYREGLEYNRTLDAKAAQIRLGWKVDVEVTGTGDRRTVAARFHDRHGRPLSGMRVNAAMVWPVATGRDRRFALAENAPGDYRAAVTLPSLGNWRLTLEAQRRDGTQWQMERKLWLK